MNATFRSIFLAATALLLPTFAILLQPISTVRAGPKPQTYWNVDDVRAGMKGQGRTVMHGTKIESFDAEVLGVLKNTSPGRDMVLCRLSGLNLEKTGVIAGMSGSPVYIENRLLGAVAYAWPFGKEPIAGITPFSQMHGFVEAYERRDLAEQNQPVRVGLNAPLQIEGREFNHVTVSQSYDEPVPAAADGLWMIPLRTPLCASGFTAHSLSVLRDQCHAAGLLPMQSGAASASIADQEQNTPLQPGGPLAVALVQGDFDLSGIGTVTHIEGNRVYGWGHPFYGMGACELPLMTGYIHTIYPRQSVSFKMGSPLRTVGVINADVSTCIAGWLERKPDLIPARLSVQGCPGETSKTFNIQIVRQRSLLPALVFASLVNSIDMQGELPDELTADLTARVEVEGHAPLVIQDTYSGALYTGGRAPPALYAPVANLINLLLYNSYKPIRINRIECETRIRAERRTADIEAVELDSETYEPGDTIKATVFLRPFKGLRQRLPVSLKLPVDLPEGNYTATVCDDLSNARFELRDNPTLSTPHTLSQLFESLQVQTAAKRTNLVVRIPINAVGVAVGGTALPNLPPSMVQILGASRRTGAQPVAGSLVARQSTTWVVQGTESVRFIVTKNKKADRGIEN
ncbi:MAG TPA: SpoIVB peptidase S55 domain-containing protein [Gemmataceae bacterium]|nr:SpoIVB peptidase S55 domain-containing protein [Gemmataceae bacterium]